MSAEASNAFDLADDAARRSGVTVRTLDGMSGYEDMIALFDQVWQPDATSPLLTREQAQALGHAGNYLAGAYADGRMVGACLGFFGAPPGVRLHSHIAGVRGEVRGRSVGFALKLHQRAWALDRGLTEITWTFDPLVRRNAYFNLVKLGALPVEYLVDFYGDIRDGINAGQGSDRLLVGWDLLDRDAPWAGGDRGAGDDVERLRAEGAVVALWESEAGCPERAADGASTGPARILVQTPTDIEDLRRHDPATASAWRDAVRDVLGGLVSDGARVRGFTRTGCYVVERA